jgi:hypothetical protein
MNGYKRGVLLVLVWAPAAVITISAAALAYVFDRIAMDGLAVMEWVFRSPDGDE